MAMSRAVLMCTIFVTVCAMMQIDESQSNDSEAVVLRAVRGHTARLTCGNKKVFLDGPQAYVLWLKDGEVIYRFPTIDDAGLLDLHCEACDFTALILRTISDKDSGRYRCRVHYQASPSVDHVYEVQLVDAPGTPRIYDDKDVEIVKGIMSPIALGSTLNLKCIVKDDKPDTQVYWRRNNEVVDHARLVRPGVLQADVHMPNVTRSELNAVYDCVSENSNITKPLVASVVIKMYLAPLSVEIRLNENKNFEDGRPRVVDCVVVGCVPPPYITWYLGDTMVRSYVHKEVHDGNYTVSSLTLSLSLHNDKKELVCMADNPHMPTEVFEDRVTINVGYRPKCVSKRLEKLGVMTLQPATATCIVEGSPEPHHFTWILAHQKVMHTTGIKMPGFANRYSSTLTWMPRDRDLGQVLYCTATNALGEQKQPCVYTMSIGGPPLTPDCKLNNNSPHPWEVFCKKAWDGGQPQTIHLEIFDQEGTLMQNMSAATGNFNLPEPKSNVNWTGVAYSSSIWGKSPKKIIHLELLKPTTEPAISENSAPRRQLNWYDWFRMTLILAISVGIIGFIAYFMSKASARAPRPVDAEPNPDLVPKPDGSFHREPDFTRDERAISGTTTITVNQLANCQSQYSASPVSSYRLLMGCGPQETTQHSYYV